MEPDVAEVFPDAASVNEALRCPIQDSKENKRTYSYNLSMKVLDQGSKHLDNSIIKLEPDVVETFPDTASVNEALRSLIQDSQENSTAPPHINENT